MFSSLHTHPITLSYTHIYDAKLFWLHTHVYTLDNGLLIYILMHVYYTELYTLYVYIQTIQPLVTQQKVQNHISNKYLSKIQKNSLSQILKENSLKFENSPNLSLLHI